MKYRYLLIIFLLYFSKVYSKNIDLNKEFLPLKDFLAFKLDLFLKDNIKNIFFGGGVFSVAYQKMDYSIKFNNDNIIKINIVAYMDKDRYRSKRYYPKIKDCNQIRNKIFSNKYGYSFLTQKFNNLVNEESLTQSLKEKVFNITSINKSLRDNLINNMTVRINVIHPRNEKSIACGGKLVDVKLIAQ